MNQTLELQPMVDSRPIREIAYEILKHAIIAGDIAAGERIIETDYADRLHISRTPLREALRKLERDGLVEYVLRRGCVVRAFTVEDVEEIYTIHNALEMLTLPAIIENAVPEDISRLRGRLKEMDASLEAGDIQTLSPQARAFHNDMISISRKRRILNTIRTQDEYLTRFSRMAVAKEPAKRQSQQEHYKLVQYIEDKDLAGFDALMRFHIECSKVCCIEALNEQNEAKRREREAEAARGRSGRKRPHDDED